MFTKSGFFTILKVTKSGFDCTYIVAQGGAKNSSNSNRLRDIAENFGVKAYLLNGENDEISNLLINTKILGITAGASAPEILIENLINKIRKIRDIEITNLKGIEENIKFKIPKGL